MFQVRIHGRGGQGVVTAAELLSVAAFFEDKHSQAFPMFGRSGPARLSWQRVCSRLRATSGASPSLPKRIHRAGGAFVHSTR